MKDCLIVDVSFPDDIFLINVKVEVLQKNIFQISYEADGGFICLLEVGQTVSGCKLTGKVRLSDFQVKLIHDAITSKMQIKQKKAVSKIW